jgi:hypothetical protein
MRIAGRDFREFAAVLALVVATSLSATPAQAQRPDSRTMTCDTGRSIVAQFGSVVMTTGDFTYDRVVHNRGFCQPGQETQPAYVPTLDNPRCRVGYSCRDKVITR